MSLKLNVIEAQSDQGAGIRGAAEGPQAVFDEARKRNFFRFLTVPFITIPQSTEPGEKGMSTPFAKNIAAITDSLNELSGAVESVLKAKNFPLVFSGDHSNAIGTLSGMREAFPDSRIGVIWVDAHLDLHSPFTTPSGNIHGMALNASLGLDNLENQKNEPSDITVSFWEKLKHCGPSEISPKIDARDVVLISIRDYEQEEIDLAAKHNMKIFNPDMINNLGIENVIEGSLNYLDRCDVLYVSYDVDSQDTSVSTGTGTPVPDGLLPEQSLQIFKRLLKHPKVKCFEITEINPSLDSFNKMARSVVDYLEASI